MIEFELWRDLATAYVRIDAGREGWEVTEVHVASTGSAYVRLRSPEGVVACVRLSDHRPRVGLGERLLSIRQRATGRLSQLAGWLRGVRPPTAAVDRPVA